ncbi:MAG: hypothetical protein MUC40_00675 [Akkermansiaceae bacterium]|jgi:uncharacterized protein YbjT (DUF2867 family)|nr:hypothetical protein [Akkermansiaceae bacterium]
MIRNDDDPLAMFEAAKAAAIKSAEHYAATTRRLFDTPTGREWIAAAMSKFNFMGSVFDPDDYDTHRAAARDGARAVISDILNTLAATRRQPPPDHE